MHTAKPNPSRRSFLKTAAAGMLAGPWISTRLHGAASDRIRIAVMGTNGRGLAHIAAALSQPNVEVAWICDVDDRAIAKGVKEAAKRQKTEPRTSRDIRKVLEDRELDAVTIATPNHWHAPATILACSAGKHVYVEKPGSHNPQEGEWMVAAARKHRRVVQMGNQRRSWPWVIEAINRLHSGEIGNVLFARSWYNNARGSIGAGKSAPVPDWLDWTLWQGPAPEKPFKSNLVHYNWHWLWHWGNGELGNNGIHALDLVRWGLKVDYPTRVTTGGGRYHFQDDQETPDTYVVSYDFGNKGATWEAHSSHLRGFEGANFGVIFYGDKGSMVIAGNDCRIYDPNNKLRDEIKGKWEDSGHFGNFFAGIRSGEKAHAEIEDAQKSTLLCHLGNIAWRTGRALAIDPDSGRIQKDSGAMKLWSRDYRSGWKPRV